MQSAPLDASDLLTLRYAAHLALLLAPAPALSSSLARTRRPHSRSRPRPQCLPTQCGHCEAETIGGIAGAAYWVEEARLVGSCGACGTSTVRSSGGGGGTHEVPSASAATRFGRDQFERVKKRRRTSDSSARAPVGAREVSHPTAYRDRLAVAPPAAPAAASASTPAPSSLPSTSRDPLTVSLARGASTRAGGSSTRGQVSVPLPPHAAGAITPGIRVQSEARKGRSRASGPTPETTTTQGVREPELELQSRSKSSTTEFRATPPAAVGARSDGGGGPPAPPPPAMAPPAPTEAAKKRPNKRPKKQPTGLAHLLAQKKEREAAAASGSAGGLMDFLQAL